MKKIGIAAVTYKDNFGSALQTYATQYTLEKLGYDARIFEIKGVHRSIFIKKLLFFWHLVNLIWIDFYIFRL